MRKKEFISKKLAVLLMVASILGGLVAFPSEAHAQFDRDSVHIDTQIPDNPADNTVDVIASNEGMENNAGDVNENNGYIVSNTGFVFENNLVVYENANVDGDIGQVGTNTGIVFNNKGEVGNNFGEITYNRNIVNVNEVGGEVMLNDNTHVIYDNEGTVYQNWGWVYNGSGTVEQMNTNLCTVVGDRKNSRGDEPCIGTIKYAGAGRIVNGADPEDLLTINNLFDCTIDTEGRGVNLSRGEIFDYQIDYPRQGRIHIERAFSDENIQETDLITVDKQYHSVTFEEADNIGLNYSNFIDNPTNRELGKFTQTAEHAQAVPLTGTVTLSANRGYALSDDGQLNGELDKMSYNLDKNDDGSYTMRLTSLTGNVVVTPEMLHLILTYIGGSDSDIVIADVKVDDDITVSESGGSSDNGIVDAADVATPEGVVITQKAIEDITAQVQAQMTTQNPDQAAPEVIDLYFGEKTDLTPTVLKFLCEKVPVAKRCHYNYKDQEYVMYIPAFDLVSPAYAEGLETLAKEPGRTAGFLRITQIFEKVGFATKVVEAEEQAAE